MYKSRLQELCQKRQLRLPEYTSTRDGGPDHSPLFRAKVTVDGLSFDSIGPSMNAKEAQNCVAELAFKHFSATTSAPPLMEQIEHKIPYKCQLLRLVQTKKLGPPTYNFIREGPPHALQFKATVTIDGQTFVSPRFFGTLKEAEHSAAKVAIQSWSFGETEEEDPGFYKNLLQELAQKERFSLPKYITISDGASQIPLFSSKVEIKGESFSGESASTKKQAEMNAAKVAWCKLKERRVSGSCPLSREVQEASSVSLGSTMQTRNVQLSGSPDSKSLSDTKDVIGDIAADPASGQEDDSRNIVECNHNSTTIGSTWIAPVVVVDAETFLSDTITENKSQTNIFDPETLLSDKITENNSQTKISLHGSKSKAMTKEKPVENTESEDQTLPDFSNHPVTSASAPNSEAPLFSGTCSLLSGRVGVYCRKPDMLLPDGAVMLPFSDEAWVAVSLNFLEKV